MYAEHWNLREIPFQNVIDARYAYLSDQHREGLARLSYLALQKKLGGVLIGPYGVGKSTILELLVSQVRDKSDSRFLRMDYVPGTVSGLARLISRQIGCKEVPDYLADAGEIIHLLRQQLPSLGHTVLAIDDAQMMTDPAAYHFLHLITNLTLPATRSAPATPAFTLILAGYIDVGQLVAADESLAQRLQLKWRLVPLDGRQTVEYIQHRIRVAGGDLWIFDEDAMAAVHGFAKGIPRIINNICDIAMALGAAAGVRQVDRSLVEQAAQDVSGD